MRQPIIETSWIWRRTIVIAVVGVALLAFGALTAATVFCGTDTSLSRDLVTALRDLLVVIVPAYIGGAVLDDGDQRRQSRLPPPADDPRPPPGYEGGQ